MVEYRHTFSAALAEGLFRLYRAGEAINIKQLGLTRNQWDNFQKLRYWDLVEKARDADGARIGGYWRITPTGASFVRGLSMVRRVVWTYRGERVRFDGDSVYFAQVHVGYKKRPDYAREAQPRGKGTQPGLF